MSSLISPNAAGASSPVYTVGTLQYNRRQLGFLFFWLMWNDFSYMILEAIINLNGILLKDYGATYAQIALLGSIGGILTLWVNPVVSTWSDRFRSRHGRRRPFLFAVTPPFAFFLAITPFMPDLYAWLERKDLVPAFISGLSMSGPVMLMGASVLVSNLFNAALQAIFSYLYWDVVPESHMGRFQSLSKNVTLAAGLVWSFFIFGLADNHMKAVYVGTAGFSLAIYLLSVRQIKEGDYPPPAIHEKGSVFAPIRAYLVECFGDSYFLWIFAGAALYQIGNIGNAYQFFFLRYDLKLDLSMIGWADGWSKAFTTAFGLLCGFAIGSVTDRLKPVRLLGGAVLLYALVRFVSFFYVWDKWSYLVANCATNMVVFSIGIITGAFTIEVFPREKLGQFCSAQALISALATSLLGPFVGMLFDQMKFNQFGFLWSAIFYVLSAAAYVKVYFNWKKRRLAAPVPSVR